ncbi:MAG: tRNA (adenosine(37)-N6)-threonylcarbamoyltransferase complex transferase subunit TsaD [Bacteroidetes bacterium QS_1_65_9]|nr:MAG: tRNA (adenosine(37)-N6)-threonylcarbamoyltransferase complex transferase subunit TsaD [Bacteroidetes bacterium QS_1_65_9]
MSGGVLRSSVTSAQMEHTEFGGVVPEVASRAHQRLVAPVGAEALDEAGAAFDDLDAVAVTRGPGLSGALLVGLSYAKALALGLGVELVGVNHLEGHLASVFLDERAEHEDEDAPEPPLLCLIASGGHTQLVWIEAPGAPPELLGRTRDDAAGEAFDKTAQLLGLGYPGGPEIDRLAADGDPAFHDFPRSRPESDEDGRAAHDFSFSGLKTSVLYYLKDFSYEERRRHLEQHRADLCAAIQEAVVDVLAGALFDAADQIEATAGATDLALVGGVQCRHDLRRGASSLAAWRRFSPRRRARARCRSGAGALADGGRPTVVAPGALARLRSQRGGLSSCAGFEYHRTLWLFSEQVPFRFSSANEGKAARRTIVCLNVSA